MKKIILFLICVLLLSGCFPRRSPNPPVQPVEPPIVVAPEPVEPEPITPPVVVQPTPQNNLASINTLNINNGVLIVPEGASVSLDIDLDIKALEIKGTVICADKNINLKVQYVFIDSTGILECGTQNKPYTKNLKISLRGGSTNDDALNGTHFIINRGVLSLHGASQKSWTRLGGNANKNESFLTLSENLGWKAGDTIVVTSSSQDMNEAEQHGIKSVNGRTITLNRPLSHNHKGRVETFSRNGKTWTIDNRASVALLSKNITIEAGNSSRFRGGHIMSMSQGKTFISGVALWNMGQAFITDGKFSPILARYPFHFHKQSNVSGQYFNNSSIINSNNRCAVVHESNNALVEGNVCFKFVGHGYFLEDGTEIGNRFIDNLAITSIRPSGRPILETDVRESQTSRGSSAFWISNTDNYFEGNVASGAGTGFWYFIEKPAHSIKFGSFKNNTVGSSSMGFSSCRDSGGEPGPYASSNEFLVENLTVFSSGFNSLRGNGSMLNSSAIWPCGSFQHFKNLIVYDSGGKINLGAIHNAENAGFITPTPMLISDSLFVNSNRYPRAAMSVYDGGFSVIGSHFQGYTGQSAVFTSIGASTKRTHNRFTNTTFSPNTRFMRTLEDGAGNTNAHLHPSGADIATANVHDLDGSIATAMGATFTGVGSIVVNNNLMTTGACKKVGHAAYCPYRYVNLRVEHRRNGGGIDGSLLPLSNPTFEVNGNSQVMNHLGARIWYQWNTRVNTNEPYIISSTSITNAINSGSHNVNITARYGFNGDSVIVGLRGVPNRNVVGYQRFANLAQLKTSAKGITYEGNTLYVKSVASGGNWGAEFSFTVQ